MIAHWFTVGKKSSWGPNPCENFNHLSRWKAVTGTLLEETKSQWRLRERDEGRKKRTRIEIIAKADMDHPGRNSVGWDSEVE